MFTLSVIVSLTIMRVKGKIGEDVLLISLFMMFMFAVLDLALIDMVLNKIC